VQAIKSTSQTTISPHLFPRALLVTGLRFGLYNIRAAAAVAVNVREDLSAH
jgi:hypothetical protein